MKGFDCGFCQPIPSVSYQIPFMTDFLNPPSHAFHAQPQITLQQKPQITSFGDAKQLLILIRHIVVFHTILGNTSYHLHQWLAILPFRCIDSCFLSKQSFAFRSQVGFVNFGAENVLQRGLSILDISGYCVRSTFQQQFHCFNIVRVDCINKHALSTYMKGSIRAPLPSTAFDFTSNNCHSLRGSSTLSVSNISMLFSVDIRYKAS